MLVLDEPTNHLDLESREALEDALRGFPGSLLLVSHDRALLDAVGSRTIAVEDGSLRSYEGGWAEYLEARAAREEDRPAKARKADPAKLERQLVAAEADLARIDPGDAKRHARAKRRVEELYERLEAVGG